MRAAFSLARTCCRLGNQPVRPQVLRPIQSSLRSGRSANNFSILHTIRQNFRPPPAPVKGGSALFLALTPAAFVQIADDEESNGENNGKTHEAQMLEISRQELAEQVPDRLKGSKRIRKGIWRFFDTYIVEPIATGFRFLHLLVIFVPVIATVPVIWLGVRIPDKDDERSGTIWWYGYLVWSMEQAGAAFIKLGQWAASRTDIFPTELCAVMSELHSNAPAHSLKVTRATIERAFGRKFDDIFDEFYEEPLGVGAIAQVYKAKLKPDIATVDQEPASEPQTLRARALKRVDPILKSTPQRVPSNYVAIKVLHPKIERNVRRDLRIMGFFASLINAIPTMEWLSFPDEVAQFGEMMRLQLDLRIEAANLTIFRRNFRKPQYSMVPVPLHSIHDPPSPSRRVRHRHSPRPLPPKRRRRLPKRSRQRRPGRFPAHASHRQLHPRRPPPGQYHGPLLPTQQN